MAERFKESGNPNGRPKGAKNPKTIVKQVAGEVRLVTEGGQKTRRTTLELVLIRLRNMAIEGENSRAITELHKLLENMSHVSETQMPECLSHRRLSPRKSGLRK